MNEEQQENNNQGNEAQDDKNYEASLNESTSETSSAKKGGVKGILFAVIVVAILIGGAVIMTGGGGTAVAVVNGEKITQSEYNLRLQQILDSPQVQAINIEDPEVRSNLEAQVLAEMVNTRLLLQAVEASDINVSDEEVQAEYDAIIAQLGSAEILATELERGGLTDSTFRNNIRDQLMIEQYLEATIDTDFSASDEEVNEFYDGISEQEGIPPLADIRSQIESQIVSQKEQEAVGALIAELRAEAEIETTL